MSEYMLQWDVIDWKQVKWCGEHYFFRDHTGRPVGGLILVVVTHCQFVWRPMWFYDEQGIGNTPIFDYDELPKASAYVEARADRKFHNQKEVQDERFTETVQRTD